MTVGEMMARLSAREYDDWMTYMARYPVGERAADYRAGIIAATLVNVQPQDPHKARRQPLTPDDFFPWLAVEGAPAEETAEETLARMSASFGVTGSVVSARDGV